MKNFQRTNPLLSLCGLNCGLCPMFLGKHCFGCGNGNQSCKIAKCSLKHGNIEYCYECQHYVCEHYENITDFDSFICHKNQKIDLEKAKVMGIEAYNAEQIEKIKILHELLDNYNNGRRKTFYCVAVNILELKELKALLSKLSHNQDFERLTNDQKCDYVYHLFLNKGQELNIEFKLRKK